MQSSAVFRPIRTRKRSQLFYEWFSWSFHSQDSLRFRVVSASDLGAEGREFEPWLVHPSCVLRQNNLKTLTVPFSTQVYKWEPIPWEGEIEMAYS